MKLKAVSSTDNGKLTEGKVYEGAIVWVHALPNGYIINDARAVIFDNENQWTAFPVPMFVPAVSE